jgi:hypothetical protein
MYAKCKFYFFNDRRYFAKGADDSWFAFNFGIAHIAKGAANERRFVLLRRRAVCRAVAYHYKKIGGGEALFIQREYYAFVGNIAFYEARRVS